MDPFSRSGPLYAHPASFCLRPPARPDRARPLSGSATFRLAAAILIALTAVAAIAGEPALRIGRVVIDCNDVYSASEASKGRAYRAADALHVRTREEIIRKFLLFKPGDPYVPERLAETERNLRGLGFLKAATVAVSEPHDGVVDVTVRTQDTWSLAPGTEAGMKGGAGSFGMQISDSNVAGSGQFLALSYRKDVERSRTAIDYRNPSLFAPYWQTRVVMASASDGYEHRLSLSRPFYSFATPWAAEFTFDDSKQSTRMYEDGIQVDSFNQIHRKIVAAFGRAFDANDSLARRLTFGVRTSEDAFSDPLQTSTLPEDRAYRYLFTRFERAENRFVTLDYVDSDLRVQDFDIGRRWGGEAAVSPSFMGVPATTEFARGFLAGGHAINDRSFMLARIGAESRFNSGFENAIAGASLRFVRRFETIHPQAFVARVAVNSGWRLDHEVQFFADGETGLRGYPLHAYSGSRSILINAEQRFYLGREIAQVASPGFVIFADAGNATTGGMSDLVRLHADVGAGLRIGLPRTPRNVIRIDVAMPLTPDPLGHRKPLVSISSSQAF